MNSEPISVLVVGATGNQSGAVVDHLLASGHPLDVRGFTRDTTSDAARTLSERDVEIVEGDPHDPESLHEAVAGIDTVLTVTDFRTEGYARQVQQVKNIADAAADDGVDQFAFSGAGSHDEESDWRSISVVTAGGGQVGDGQRPRLGQDGGVSDTDVRFNLSISS